MESAARTGGDGGDGRPFDHDRITPQVIAGIRTTDEGRARRECIADDDIHRIARAGVAEGDLIGHLFAIGGDDLHAIIFADLHLRRAGVDGRDGDAGSVVGQVRLVGIRRAGDAGGVFDGVGCAGINSGCDLINDGISGGSADGDGLVNIARAVGQGAGGIAGEGTCPGGIGQVGREGIGHSRADGSIRPVVGHGQAEGRRATAYHWAGCGLFDDDEIDFWREDATTENVIIRGVIRPRFHDALVAEESIPGVRPKLANDPINGGVARAEGCAITTGGRAGHCRRDRWIGWVGWSIARPGTQAVIVGIRAVVIVYIVIKDGERVGRSRV